MTPKQIFALLALFADLRDRIGDLEALATRQADELAELRAANATLAAGMVTADPETAP